MFDRQLIEEFRNTVNDTDFTLLHFFDIVKNKTKICGAAFALLWIGSLWLLII